jgi:molybdopterin biosynthesis enzyme
VLVPAGATVTPRHLVPARRAGLEAIAVRRPRVRLIDVAARAFCSRMESSGVAQMRQEQTDGRGESLALVRALLRAEGAAIVASSATARDAGAIAAALDAEGADLLLTVGGTGFGRTDAVAAAIAARGTLLAHGIALSPGRSAALGRIGAVPVLALPGAPEGALAAWLALGLPLLDRLAGRRPRMVVPLPLARKIASTVGLCELALLKREGAAWQPLAVGAFPLGLIAAADAWLAVPAASEGHAASETVAGFLFGDAP